MTTATDDEMPFEKKNLGGICNEGDHVLPYSTDYLPVVVF